MADNEELNEEQARAQELNTKMLYDMATAGKTGIDAQVELWLKTTKLGKVIDGLGKATKKATAGVKDSAKTMASSTGDFTDLNAAVAGVIGAMAGLAGSIPLIGGMIEGVTNVGIEVLTLSMQRTQAGYASFQAMAQAGQIGAEGVTGLAQSLHETSVPLATYASLLTKNSEALAYFNSSALSGGKSFEKIMSKMAGDQGMVLRNLGFSVEEIGETAIHYQRMQQRLGIAQEMDQDKLAASVAKYGQELDTIAKLTGKSRKDIQKQRDESLRESRYLALLSTLAPEARERMQRGNALASSMSEETGKIYRAAATNFVRGDAERRSIISGTYQNIQAWSESVKQGTTNDQFYMNQHIKDSQRYSKQMGKVVSALGDDAPGTNFVHIDRVAKMELRNIEDIAAVIKKIKDTPDRVTDTLNREMRRNQQSTSEMDAMLIGSDAAVAVITEFSSVIEKLIDKIADEFGVETKNVKEKRITDEIKAEAAGREFNLGINGPAGSGTIDAKNTPENKRLQELQASIISLTEQMKQEDAATKWFEPNDAVLKTRKELMQARADAAKLMVNTNSVLLKMIGESAGQTNSSQLTELKSRVGLSENMTKDMAAKFAELMTKPGFQKGELTDGILGTIWGDIEFVPKVIAAIERIAGANEVYSNSTPKDARKTSIAAELNQYDADGNKSMSPIEISEMVEHIKSQGLTLKEVARQAKANTEVSREVARVLQKYLKPIAANGT